MFLESRLLQILSLIGIITSRNPETILFQWALIVIDRSGKKKQRQYFKEGAPFLLIDDDQVIVNKQQSDTLELLTQAAIVFRLVYIQYDSERSSTTIYYPIITSTVEDK